MLKKFGVLLAALTMVFALGACSVEKTDEGEMPSVEVKGGELPEYDVDTAEVDISMSTQTVTVPDVDIDVKTGTQTATVPDVDVDVKPPQQ
jgi:hypothetical protein